MRFNLLNLDFLRFPGLFSFCAQFIHFVEMQIYGSNFPVRVQSRRLSSYFTNSDQGSQIWLEYSGKFLFETGILAIFVDSDVFPSIPPNFLVDKHLFVKMLTTPAESIRPILGHTRNSCEKLSPKNRFVRIDRVFIFLQGDRKDH